MKDVRHIFHCHQWQICFSVVFIILSLSAQVVWGVDQSYYSTINNTSGSTLRNNLYTITSAGPTNMSYDKLWTAYKTTDVYPKGHANAGKIWDMYSDCIFTAGGSGSGGQCGTYSDECDCYNREHSMPKSWFNESKPAYYDLGHIVPTDGKVNGVRSNYAFGEVDKSTHTFSHSASKFGTAKAVTTANVKGNKSITTTYTGTVYEPDDQYKGDFARMYMYMRVRYKDMNITTGDGAKMFNSTDSEYGMTDYSIALLMKWHRQDPVSQKEIDRNNGMQSVQGNRNPFIDYPALAEYLWGSKQGETFKFSDVVASFSSDFVVGECDGFNNTDPAISSPSGAINVGITTAGTPAELTFKVQGRNLTSGNLTLGLSGTNASLFSLSTTSVTKAQAEAGHDVVITYSPTANGNHTATLTISGCGVTSHAVTLTGTCEVRYVINWRTDEGLYNTNTAANGDKPSVPDAPDDCSATRVFVGWTLQSGYNNASTAPADLFTESSDAINITKDTTFYAVYADASEGAGNVTKSMTSFTTISGNVDGDTNVSYAAAKGSAANDPVVNSSQIRIYQNGGLLTITANNSKKLTSITIGSAMSTTVTYSVDGGSASSNQSISANGTFTLNNINASSVVFTCKGTSSSTRLYLNSLSVTYSGGSVASYSNYSTQCATGPTATITFHANGGTGSMETQTVSQNKSTALHANEFTRSGYTFAGWATSAGGTVMYDDEETINTDSDLDLYAKWEEIQTYTVTWMANGSTHLTQNNVVSGDRPNVPASTPSNCSETRLFQGWTAESSYSSESSAPADLFTELAPAITGNTTFYAVYADQTTSPTPSTATFAADDITETPLTGTLAWTHTESGITLTLSAGQRYISKTPYTFSVTKGTSNYAQLSGNKTITQVVATISGTDYAIGSVSTGSLSTSSTTQTISSINGTSVTLYATANYQIRLTQLVVSYFSTTLANYSLDCSGATPVSHTVTFMNNGVEYATRTGTTGSAMAAVSNPTACEGYTFEGWSTSEYAVDNTSAPSLSTPTTIPAANTTYYAVYSKTESSGGGSSTTNVTASSDLVSGTTTAGYTFGTAKNGGNSDPTYNGTGGDVRLYAKNQITISASSSITEIVFNISTQGLKRLAPITASAGTIAAQSSGDNTVTWTGSATSVTFTVGNNADYGSDGSSKAGQLCFTSVDITSGGGSSTTYHTTAPNCCQATLTVVSPDDTMGTVGIE